MAEEDARHQNGISRYPGAWDFSSLPLHNGSHGLEKLKNIMLVSQMY